MTVFFFFNVNSQLTELGEDFVRHYSAGLTLRIKIRADKILQHTNETKNNIGMNEAKTMIQTKHLESLNYIIQFA